MYEIQHTERTWSHMKYWLPVKQCKVMWLKVICG